ncbi:MAG: phosphomannomutase/phosphoglucomutase [Lachnospiraceae bacterium]|nr:phosphomannomutase/phosphoglucomutase [Lachnospiraceae bacterium]
MKYSKLQNGSDIRGVAMENNAGEAVNLTEDAVKALARAFAVWLKETKGENIRVAIGRDSRLTGPQIVKWAIDGLNMEGVPCTDFDMASTPAMFMSTVLTDDPFDGAIMITASHLPQQRNGMKFFTRNGGLEKTDIAKLVEIAETSMEKPAKETPENSKEDFISVYADHLCDVIKKSVNAEDYEHPLKGFHIIVDAGNGAGGFFESKVLKKLGADTTGSQFLEPDGSFPNHIPNPENADAAKAIVSATLASKADLGIIFDTDVDRAGAVLSDGTELTRNALIAMMSAILIREHPGCEIVTDSITSTGLAQFIGELGGVHKRFKRGYKNVINEAIKLNSEGIDCELAMETSGHGALKENYFLDDGAYLMVKLLIEIGKGNDLKEMIAALKEPKEAVEIRFAVEGDVPAVQDAALKALEEGIAKVEGWTVAPDNFEGIRVNADETHGNGWLLLRKSLHDPIMPLNIESDNDGGCKVIAKDLYEILKDVDGLVIAPLAEFIK